MSDTTRTPFLSRYQIVSQIGEGASGRIYQALDEHLNRPVALRCTLPGEPIDATLRERFQRESMALSRIHHPLLPAMYDAVVEGKRLFVAMEFIQGESLAERLAAPGRLSVQDIIRLGMDLARGLSAVHAAGVVHANICPENVLLGAGHRAYLIGFGRAMTAAFPTPMPGAHPAYRSPEAQAGTLIDHRSDMYAYGVILFACFTGTTPLALAAEGVTDLAGVLRDETERLADAARGDRRTELRAQWLAKIMLRCLEAEPEARYQAMAELLTDLKEIRLIADMVGSAYVPAMPTPDPEPVSRRAPAPVPVAGYVSATPARRKAPVAVWMGVAAVLVTVALGWFILTRPFSAAPASPPTLATPAVPADDAPPPDARSTDPPPTIEAAPAPAITNAVPPAPPQTTLPETSPEIAPETAAETAASSTPPPSARAAQPAPTQATPPATTQATPPVRVEAPPPSPLGGGMVTREALEQARRARSQGGRLINEAPPDALPDSTLSGDRRVTRDAVRRAGGNNR